MNKKFLNLILCGALMSSSTGMFTSCKNYDGDIAGLDDRIIALLKLLAERQVEAQYPEFHTTGCYFIRDEEGKFIIHLIDDGTNEALNVDYEASFAELYETLRNEFSKELEEQSKDVPVIDKAWAVSFLDAVMK